MTVREALVCLGLLVVVLWQPAAIADTAAPAPAIPDPPAADAVRPGSAVPEATVPEPVVPGTPEPEVTVQAPEPRFVAPTRRDRIGRIWAPVLINGKGPFRFVLDTGANHSALTPASAAVLGSPGEGAATLVTGFTGSAVVPSISVSSLEVGELLMGPTRLPVVADVFGGAQGVLGYEGLSGKRIFADFAHDRLVIAHSHKQPAAVGFSVVPLKEIYGGLLMADARLGGIRCKAIIDTGSQGSVGNVALRNALIRHRPEHQAQADIVGVTLAVQTGDYVSAPNIDLGSVTISGVHLTFADMYLFEHWKLTDTPVLLLGMDVLGLLDVLIIDYRMSELQIRLAHERLPGY